MNVILRLVTLNFNLAECLTRTIDLTSKNNFLRFLDILYELQKNTQVILLQISLWSCCNIIFFAGRGLTFLSFSYFYYQNQFNV